MIQSVLAQAEVVRSRRGVGRSAVTAGLVWPGDSDWRFACDTAIRIPFLLLDQSVNFGVNLFHVSR